MLIIGNHFYSNGFLERLNLEDRHKSRPYTKGPHMAKIKNKRHKRNKVARQTRKKQRRAKK